MLNNKEGLILIINWMHEGMRLIKKSLNVSGKSKLNFLWELHQPRGKVERLLFHHWRKHWMWKINIPWTPQTKNSWSQMDLRTSCWMAKSWRKTNQHARKILHRSQKMGIYLPDICHLYQDQEAPRGHGKIPRQT